MFMVRRKMKTHACVSIRQHTQVAYAYGEKEDENTMKAKG